MAIGRPNHQVYLNALERPRIKTLQDAIETLTPTSDGERIVGSTNHDQIREIAKNKIFMKILTLEGARDLDTFKKLGRSLSYSGIETTSIGDWEGGLTPLAKRAFKWKNNNWIKSFQDTVPGVMWRVINEDSEKIKEWINDDKTPIDLIEKTEELLIKMLRKNNTKYPEAWTAVLLINTISNKLPNGSTLNEKDIPILERIFDEAKSYGNNYCISLIEHVRMNALSTYIINMERKPSKKQSKL